MAAAAPRQILLACFEAALAAVDARRRTFAALDAARYAGDWHVLAIGKAAGAMTLGALERLGPRVLDALVVTRPGHVPPALAAAGPVRIVESSHPVPDARSLSAGETVAGYVAAMPRRAQVLCLVSGGASSLVERLVRGVSLEDLVALNAWALASGCTIGQTNALRRALSTLKGGGLASLIAPRRCEALFVSDVPGDDPAVIGSGLLHAADRRAGLPAGLPPELRRVLARAGARSRAAKAPGVPCQVVASVHHARAAAGEQGRRQGLDVRVSRHRFAGDAGRLGPRFARTVLAARPRTLCIWGGESTMILPARPGYGGRNQHLALAAAVAVAGRRDVTLLAGGTDGTDGVTADAGAVIDGATVVRGVDAGLDARECLRTADSGRFLEASGDLLHTGPTLTNVGDVVLGLRGRNRVE